MATSRDARWRAANREKIAASNKRYRESEKGRAAISKYGAMWRKKNREKINEQARQSRETKSIENAYNEWNDTLRELGYGDLV